MKRRSASIHASISSSGVMLFAMCRSYGFRWPDSVGAITLPTMAISDEKYVNLTTFTRGGRPKPTPVWITDTGDGTVGFTTFSTSWKVKRINNDAKVTIQPSDARGNPTAGTEVLEGTAVALQGQEFERVKKLIQAKYGIQFAMINLVGKVRAKMGKDSGTDTAIVITLNGS